ncbi:AAA family ATPase [Mesorhizobium microcysteis]|uniref:non-specific serine/threonine protein kinase n=1 Tax=Neoaquamicrobium microcysteis TaxID=2682781 RepID=A0A5D4GV15_9HYPH|nr:ATPase domain-containing protein [Mesorhizobium microcysteis]TYR31609.1 AAA family ATPase [Mesorhizobium microcysteis]
MTKPVEIDAEAISSGVPGLDYVLRGGFPASRSHLIEGRPGSGKTTLGLQFLMDGRDRGERCLYITLSESRRELMAVAHRHGFDLNGIEIFELVPPELSLDQSQHQTLVHSSDLELGETVQIALNEIDRLKPQRVVFDSLSEIRLLSQGTLRYRRQVLALKSYFLLNDCTVLLLDDLTSEQDDLNLHSVCHGVVRLDQLAPIYGGERRRLRVIKMRGVQIRGGYHDFVIRPGGLTVFPRLVASDHPVALERDVVVSNTRLDTLLGGGLARGTSTLLMGPSGTGKSSIALAFVRAALERGESAFFIVFDETMNVVLERASGMGFALEPHIQSGKLRLVQVDPAEVSPGELSARIRDAVEDFDARIVVIDSLSGYLNAMPEENYLVLQMHEILSYLNQKGVVTLLLLASHGLVGQMTNAVDLTYVSDNVLLLRYFEAEGRIRRAVSVVKKRTGAHEDTIREFTLSNEGIVVGNALSDFTGVLTGVPTYRGPEAKLMKPPTPGAS